MKFDDIQNMLKTLNIPVTYYQFDDDTEVAPPFCAWYSPGIVGFYADNIVYAKQYEINIELYTDDKNWALEEALENILEANEIPYRKTESYIDSEKLFMQLYEAEVFLNGK